MATSLHDALLVGYRVDCRARTIQLDTEYCEGGGSTGKVAWRLSAVFSGVHGYHLEDDAFVNIIYSLREVPGVDLYREFASAIQDSFHQSGAPGPWAESEDKAIKFINDNALKGFILDSSLGISGWFLAKALSFEQ